MAAPTVQERLTALLDSRRTGDPENDVILDAIIGGFADAMDRLGIIAFGTDDVPVGRALDDPSVAPSWAIAHAAQYTGAILPGREPGETEDAWLVRARDVAVYPGGLKRGTEEAVRRAATALLIGSQRCHISYSDDPYEVVITVLASQTPDPAAFQAALEGSYVSGGERGAIRAEQKLALRIGQSYDDVALLFADYDELDSFYTDYDQLFQTT